MSNTGPQISSAQMSQELDEEVYQTHNANDDFDQLNEEKMRYAKFAHTPYNQQSHNIDQEPVDKKQSMNVFANESTQAMNNRHVL